MSFPEGHFSSQQDPSYLVSQAAPSVIELPAVGPSAGEREKEDGGRERERSSGNRRVP